MRDKILETIYCDGNPNGIRIIQRKLSTIKAYVIPRDLLSAAKEITDINRPGIYYLINEADDNIIVQLYVGQTRNGISRLDDHHRKKDYWNKAIMFLSDSSTFSLDMISGLEKYAIKNACLSNRYKVENGVVPKFNIGKYEMSLVEEAYQEIQFIMSGLRVTMN